MELLKQTKNLYQFSKHLREYLHSNEENKKRLSAQFLTHMMAQEKGLFLKIGQFLGTGEDNLNEFKKLTQGQVEPMPFAVVRELLQAHFCNGKQDKLENYFDLIDERPHPASIGQVHYARLLNGEELALKVQYPDIHNSISQLMRLFQWIPNMGPAKKWGFDLEGYKSTLVNNFENELNYLSEGHNLQRFYKYFENSKEVRIPKYYEDLSSPTLLVQQWATGVPLSEAMVSLSPQQKLDFGERLITNFFQQLFLYGLVQGDSNEGNYLFTSEGRLTLIDFGSCLEIPKQTRLLLLKLVISYINRAEVDPVDYLVGIGFEANKLIPLHNGLPLLLDRLFEPFKLNRPFNLNQWEISDVAERAFRENKWMFRAAGPPYFFLLMRSFTGLIDMIKGLGVHINYQKLLYKSCAQLLPQIVHCQPPRVSKQSVTFQSLAQNIHIKVLVDNKEKVSMQLPINTLMHLEEFIDEPVLEGIAKKGVSVKDLCDQAIAKGALPQNLFEHSYENKHIKVWME